METLRKNRNKTGGSKSPKNVNGRNSKKKRIKFSESYFDKNLGSMEDFNAINKQNELKIDNKRSYYASPYLKSRMIRENIRNVYKIGKGLGTGQFGTVRVASPYSRPKEKVAIKSVPREASEDYLRQLEKELRILKDVDHPNIIKFFETYQDQKYFHFVIEYCDGGELFDRLTKIGHYYEKDAARIIKKL